MMRKIAVTLIFLCLALLPQPVTAQGLGMTIGGVYSDSGGTYVGCGDFEMFFDATITGIDPEHTYSMRTTVNNGSQIYTDNVGDYPGEILAILPYWGIVESNEGGTKNTAFPMASGVLLTMRVYADGVFLASKQFYCNADVTPTPAPPTATPAAPTSTPGFAVDAIDDSLLSTAQSLFNALNPILLAILGIPVALGLLTLVVIQFRRGIG